MSDSGKIENGEMFSDRFREFSEWYSESRSNKGEIGICVFYPYADKKELFKGLVSVAFKKVSKNFEKKLGFSPDFKDFTGLPVPGMESVSYLEIEGGAHSNPFPGVRSDMNTAGIFLSSTCLVRSTQHLPSEDIVMAATTSMLLCMTGANDAIVKDAALKVRFINEINGAGPASAFAHLKATAEPTGTLGIHGNFVKVTAEAGRRQPAVKQIIEDLKQGHSEGKDWTKLLEGKDYSYLIR